MHTLIIDRFDCQPMYKRLQWTSLTAVGWLFWISLWLPLLGSARLSFGADQAAVLPSSSLQGLFATLGTHAAAIIAASSLFLAWSLLQSYRNGKKRLAAVRPTVTSRHLAQSVKIRERDLIAWQNSQRMLVIHDENSGWICEVKVLGALAQSSAA